MAMKKWLEEALVDWLPRMAPLTDGDRAQADALAGEMKALWVARGLGELSQQRVPMTEIRGVLKRELGDEHIGLVAMNFSTAEWRQMNEPIAKRATERNEHMRFIDDTEAVADTTRRLLRADYWPEVAAGLAMATGRRSTELLHTAVFEQKSVHSVLFLGQLKSRGRYERVAFEIPTLAPAELVLIGLELVRRQVDCTGLTRQAINKKYGPAVVEAVKKHFAGLVPPREGDDDLYAHLCRAVYGRIAVLWFCPRAVGDIEFLAHIQGHRQVLEAQDEEEVRSYTASRHYWDYQIADGHGNVDGRKGIKLGQPLVEVLEVFHSSATHEEVGGREMGYTDGQLEAILGLTEQVGAGQTNGQDQAQQAQDETEQTDRGEQPVSDPLIQRGKPTTCRVFREDLQALEILKGVTGATTQANNLHQVIALAKLALDAAQLLGVEPNGLLEHCRERAEDDQRAEAEKALSEQDNTEHFEHLQQRLEAAQRVAGEQHDRAQDLEGQLQHMRQRAETAQARRGTDPLPSSVRTTLLRLAQQTLTLAQNLEDRGEQDQAAKAMDVATELLQLARTLATTPTGNKNRSPVTTTPVSEPVMTTDATPSRIARVAPQPAEATRTTNDGAERKTRGRPPRAKVQGTQTDDPSPPARRAPGGAEARIHAATGLLFQHNDQATEQTRRWMINQTALATLTGSNRPAIQRYLAEHRQLIDQHNRRHGLTEGHNRSRGHKAEKITDDIKS